MIGESPALDPSIEPLLPATDAVLCDVLRIRINDIEPLWNRLRAVLSTIRALKIEAVTMLPRRAGTDAPGMRSLAERLALELGAGYVGDGFRETQRRPDARTLTRSERELVLSKVGATLDPPDAVRGRRVLVLDDVIDTGTNLRNAARFLLSAGASQVVPRGLVRVANEQATGRRLLRQYFAPQAEEMLANPYLYGGFRRDVEWLAVASGDAGRRLWCSDVDGTLVPHDAPAALSAEMVGAMARWLDAGHDLALLSSRSMRGLIYGGLDIVAALASGPRPERAERLRFLMANGGECYRVRNPEVPIGPAQVELVAPPRTLPQNAVASACARLAERFQLATIAVHSPLGEAHHNAVVAVYLGRPADGKPGQEIETQANDLLRADGVGFRITFLRETVRDGGRMQRFDGFATLEDHSPSKSDAALALFGAYDDVVFTGDAPRCNDRGVFELASTMTKLRAYHVHGPDDVIKIVTDELRD